MIGRRTNGVRQLGRLVKALAALAAIGSAAEIAAAPEGSRTFVLEGATLHPVSRPPIAGGAIWVQDGRIREIGATVAAPTSVPRIDLTGKHLYPGFIQPFGTMGLVEIGSVRGTVDTREVGDVNANLRAETAFNADSHYLEPSLSGGVLTAHVAAAGGTWNGTSAVMNLRGWNWHDMTLRSPAGFVLTWPEMVPSSSPFNAQSRQSPEEFERQRDEQLRALDETWARAEAYRKARLATAAGSPRVDFDPVLEAFAPAFDDSAPLFIRAADRPQIEAALDWVGKKKVRRAVLVTGADAALVARKIATAKVAVILDGVLTLPSRPSDPYDAPYAAAAALHAAGVRFAIGDGDDPSNARNLPFHAAMAAAFGLDREVALRSVTLSAAEILGVEDQLGSLEAGRRATFFLSDGDPLEIRTHIEGVWIDGSEFDLTQDRQHQLYERYDHRPKPAISPATGAAPR